MTFDDAFFACSKLRFLLRISHVLLLKWVRFQHVLRFRFLNDFPRKMVLVGNDQP